MIAIGQTRSERDWRTGWIAGAFLIYGAGAWLLYPLLDGAVLHLSVLPVVVAAWFYYLRGGLLASVAALGLSILILLARGTLDLDNFLRSGLPGMAVLLCVGGVVGWTRELQHRLRDESAARQQIVASLYESEERLRTVTDHAPIALFAIDRTGRFSFAAGRGLARLGVSPADLLGRTPHDVFGDAPVLREQLRQVLNGEQLTTLADIHGLMFEVSYVPIHDEHGAVTSTIGVATDVTERAARQAAVAHQAHHDPLTDLPNRLLFQQRLDAALAHGRGRHTLGLLFLDLDRFKAINDTLGHDSGDLLLIEVTRRLRESVRPQDTVARLGGDEFTVLLDRIGGEQAAIRVVERISASLRAPFSIAAQEVSVTVSIGIALSDPALPHETTADLVRYADMAMYQAKRNGKARYALFDRDLGQGALQRLGLETDLRYALEREQLSVAYQPQFDLRSGELVGLEALLRWQHPQRGPLAPGEFLPLALSSGLIVPLGHWLLETACRETCRWQRFLAPLTDPDARPLAIGVNLALTQLQDAELATTIARVLVETELQPGSLKLEITEATVVSAGAGAVLDDLRALGVQLAIDDFGSGWSSVSQLRQFPIDQLKLAPNFVRGLDAGPQERDLVGGLIGLAHGLGLRICAEGVESAAQAAALREQGCDLAQGYYFSLPLTTAQVDDLLRERMLTAAPAEQYSALPLAND